MLKHWTVYLTAPASAKYIPFRGEHPGSIKGQHHLNMGIDYPTEAEHIAEVKKYALSIFPLATITEIWEITIVLEKIRRVV